MQDRGVAVVVQQTCRAIDRLGGQYFQASAAAGAPAGGVSRLEAIAEYCLTLGIVTRGELIPQEIPDVVFPPGSLFDWPQNSELSRDSSDASTGKVG